MSESIQQNEHQNNGDGSINDNSSHSSSSSTSSNSNDEMLLSKQRKELFGDCALIEIIHLHDCLRGALKALEYDVKQLAASVESTSNATTTTTGTPTPTTEALERRVAGRFKVIWTVFKSHSHAEDEFIWPALKTKTAGRIDHHHDRPMAAPGNNNIGMNHNNGVEHGAVFVMINPPVLDDAPVPAAHVENVAGEQQPEEQKPVLIEQEEYEEDHADEERMFSQMDSLLTNIREAIISNPPQHPQQQPQAAHREQQHQYTINNNFSLSRMVQTLVENTQNLSQHLMAHLQKEENQCMPLVKQHLSKDEIHELVGQIMGQRSADMIAQIMTMAIQNLNPSDRHEMVKYMKESMAGTFFDRWLLMSGWMKDINSHNNHIHEDSNNVPSAVEEEESVATSSHRNSVDIQQDDDEAESDRKISATESVIGQQEQQRAQQSESDDATFGAMMNVAVPVLSTAVARTATSINNDDADDCSMSRDVKRIKTSYDDVEVNDASAIEGSSATGTNSGQSTPTNFVPSSLLNSSNNITSQAELEKLIRAIATNPSLTPAQKNTTIQGLRDSVWKSNQRHKQLHQQPPTVVNQNPCPPVPFQDQQQQQQPRSSTSANSNNLNNNRTRRVTPPSAYFRKNESGQIEAVWPCHHHRHHLQPILPAASLQPNNSTVKSDGCNDSNSLQLERDANAIDPAIHNVPLFSASELAPSYHDGAAGTVLGCPHYARACKVRHPKSGRLYTCLICCEQQRELPNGERDDTLDRYAVTEVMCMKCTALQPAGDRCVNPECESHGKPFAKYFCNICHLYDDGSRPIFHCPYCNICRLGLGLGIDFRHCMRCNACVSLADKDHRCIPQKLQGNCPICREELFLSTEPLRGLKCGHVMHLSCFVEYRRGLSYTCPLCMRAMEDMTDYFALLDAAIRMQPMPLAYLNTMSNIYCQECTQTCRVPFHFIGKKCSHCGSYNTRELGRVQVSPTTSPILNA